MAAFVRAYTLFACILLGGRVLYEIVRRIGSRRRWQAAQIASTVNGLLPSNDRIMEIPMVNHLRRRPAVGPATYSHVSRRAN